jgi:2,3-bisphosphoglycerate-dependent phosphoglycerate mutase
MAQLILVRHGESEWNAKGLWTGWTDINLSENGRVEAQKAGELLKDVHPDFAYTSSLKRAQQTLEEIQKVIGTNLQPTIDKALNERDYGDYTGKNKWDIKKEVGEEEFQRIRRSWDYPPPNGESLKMVYDRVLPYYESEILPKLKEGKNVIIAAHGNSLRALIKHLENISDEEIPTVELATGGVYVYTLDANGIVTNKEIRGSTEDKV